MATSQYSTLKARGYRHGVTIRPSDTPSWELQRYWPHRRGQEVPWVTARPIEEADDQRAALGWGLAGILGNTAHRRKHGDHTPWSVISGRAKIRNIVWAIDIYEPAWLEKHLVAVCRISDYDTTWIDYLNINGRQYNYAGQVVASSGDYHLHLAVESGAWDESHTLLYDAYRHYKGWPLLRGRQVDNPLSEDGGDDVPLTDADVEKLATTDGYFDAPRVDPGGNEIPEDRLTNKTWKLESHLRTQTEQGRINGRLLREAKLRDEAVLAAVRGLDTDAVLARIDEVAEEEATRDAAMRELLERHADGSLDAAEVVRRMGEMLSGSPA